MRNNSSNRRSRGRNNNSGGARRSGGNNRSQVFDSNGPDVRIRGTAHQVNEKYLALAKDAASGGDLILAESYLQHAEHYQRIINSWNKDDDLKKADQQENSAQEQEETKSAPKKRAAKKQANEDELSLPASILTPSPIDEKTMQDA